MKIPGTDDAIAGAFCLFLGNAISASAGIGGGGLNVSILLVIFQFSFDEAVSLSLCNVCGNYVSQIIVNSWKHHPKARSRPLIDWFAVAVLVPAQLSGNTVGVIFSRSVPDTVLEIFSVLVLTFATLMTIRNCYKSWQKDVILRSLAQHLLDQGVALRNKIVVSIDAAGAAASNSLFNPLTRFPESQRGLESDERTVSGVSARNQAENSSETASNAMETGASNSLPSPSEEAFGGSIYKLSRNYDSENAPVLRLDKYLTQPKSTPSTPNRNATSSTTSSPQRTTARRDEEHRSSIDSDSHESIASRADLLVAQTRGNRYDSEADLGSRNQADGLFDYSTDDESFSAIFTNTQVIMKIDGWIIIELVLLWLAYGAVFVGFQLGMRSCSPAYYSLLALSILPLIVAFSWAFRYVSNQQRLDTTLILDGDIDFSELSFRSVWRMFVIGVLSSWLGIGGGELVGPLLLALGLLPLVSTATTSVMSFMSASSNVLHYGVRSQIDLRWGAIVFAIGFVGGTAGRNVLFYLIGKYKRTSITTLALSFVLFLSVWVMVFKIAASNNDFIFTPLCVIGHNDDN